MINGAVAALLAFPSGGDCQMSLGDILGQKSSAAPSAAKMTLKSLAKSPIN